MTIYRHKKTGGYYSLIDEGLIEATMVEAVIYKSLTTDQIWIRPKEEFFDGRFEVVK